MCVYRYTSKQPHGGASGGAKAGELSFQPRDAQAMGAAAITDTSYLESHVVKENRPLYPKVAHDWDIVAQNSRPLAFEVPSVLLP